MRVQTVVKAFAASAIVSLLVACGGTGLSPATSSTTGSTSGGTTTGTTGSTTGGTTGTVVTGASVTLLASSSQLPSADSLSANGLTITAIVKDASNNLVSGATVAFSTTVGALEVQSSTTGTDGQATAILSTGGDPKDQSVVIMATSGSTSATLTLPEVGTSLAVTGPLVVGSTATATYSVVASDSSGNPLAGQSITLASSLGNTISPASATTDSTGKATFTYTGTTGGADTLTASSVGLGTATTQSVSVSNTNLVFQTPAANTVVDFGTVQTVTVQYTESGAAVAGATVNFSASRGTLNGTSSSSASVVTSSTGQASVTIQSSGAGGAGGSIVTAEIANGPTSSLPLVLDATTPATVSVQATPTTIAPSGTSTIKAMVLDANNNLVANQTVDFTLSDVTGGTLTAASGVTDQSGSVTVTYDASTVTSAANGVSISAQVSGTSIQSSSPALITVGGAALRITLGTGNTESALDDTRYQQPYSVIITDSAGNPAPTNATFNLSILSIAYQKGNYSFNKSVGAWQPQYQVTTSDPDFNSNDLVPFGCKTEDPNGTGVYSVSLDYNGNGVLDPGAVASVPSSVTLDNTGSAEFEITYPKDHGNWVEVRLTAIGTVEGTETTASTEFTLPVLASDLSNANTSPPGFTSPYGQTSSCADPQ